MKTSPLDRGIIPLNTIPTNRQRRREKRKVLTDAFLFLLFLSLIGIAIALSFLNDYLFLDRLLVGTFIIGALATIKWMNKDD